MKKRLTSEELRIIQDKGTEPPFSGEYVDFDQKGIYRCKQCGEKLFDSAAKFHSQTGWPSFDEALPEAIREIPDPDGARTEVVCARCNAHLGHKFTGENFTSKNVRFCVNSLSLQFKSKGDQQ